MRMRIFRAKLWKHCALGHDVLTVAEAGNAGRGVPDAEVLEFATQQERAVITLNRWDFVRLHGESPNHSGIIVCPLDPDTARQAERIDAAIRTRGSLNGKLIRVNRP